MVKSKPLMEESKKTFNHLKIHTQYSICEGAIKIDELSQYCNVVLLNLYSQEKI